MIELSDELLMAYVDGQLDKPQTTVVTRLARSNEELANRVGRMQQTQARLLETFGALIREGTADAPKTPGTAGMRGAAQRGASFFTAGTVAALLLIGVSVGMTGAYYSGFSAPPGEQMAMQMPPVSWVEDMASLHAFFTAETLAVSPESQTNPEVVKFQLAKVSQSLSLPDFSAQGLKFARGQMMSYHGGKLIQLVYTSKTEPLVALYIASGETDAALLPGQFGDVKTISWGTKKLRFVIAANMTHEALQALAAVAQSQIGAG